MVISQHQYFLPGFVLRALLQKESRFAKHESTPNSTSIVLVRPWLMATTRRTATGQSCSLASAWSVRFKCACCLLCPYLESTMPSIVGMLYAAACMFTTAVQIPTGLALRAVHARVGRSSTQHAGAAVKTCLRSAGRTAGYHMGVAASERASSAGTPTWLAGFEAGHRSAHPPSRPAILRP